MSIVKMSPFGDKRSTKSKHREGRQSEQATNNELVSKERLLRHPKSGCLHICSLAYSRSMLGKMHVFHPGRGSPVSYDERIAGIRHAKYACLKNGCLKDGCFGKQRTLAQRSLMTLVFFPGVGARAAITMGLGNL